MKLNFISIFDEMKEKLKYLVEDNYSLDWILRKFFSSTSVRGFEK